LGNLKREKRKATARCYPKRERKLRKTHEREIPFGKWSEKGSCGKKRLGVVTN